MKVGAVDCVLHMSGDSEKFIIIAFEYVLTILCSMCKPVAIACALCLFCLWLAPVFIARQNSLSMQFCDSLSFCATSLGGRPGLC